MLIMLDCEFLDLFKKVYQKSIVIIPEKVFSYPTLKTLVLFQ